MQARTPQTPCQESPRLQKGSLNRTGGRLELIQGHAHGNICVLDHLHKFLETDLAVAILVGFHNGLVDNLTIVSIRRPINCAVATHLLQLLILQIASNHHLQDNEELAIADISVAVDVVDTESEAQLLFLVAFAAER